MEHVEATTGSCVSITKGSCEKIARRKDKKFYERASTTLPLGCYLKRSANAFFFNPSHSGVDCQNDRVCMCALKHGKSHNSHMVSSAY